MPTAAAAGHVIAGWGDWGQNAATMQNITRYLHLIPDAELPALADQSPYKAVLIVEADVPDMTRWEISRWLVESGCVHAQAWGRDAAAWAESIEDANLEAFNYDGVPPERLVIAAAHEDEELGEAFWYARHRARHPAHELKTTMLLHIADAPRREELEAEFAQA